MHALVLVVALFFPRVDPGLQNAWQTSIAAWGGLRPVVREVRWCRDEECDDDSFGGGDFDYDTHTIVIWREGPWPNWSREGVTVTLMHEYGHALGLGHTRRSDRISIMNQGWQEPFAMAPTSEDINEAKRLRK